MTADSVSAYVHIPFCRRRCFYCDFPISVLGNQRRGETSMTVDRYVEILCEEIATTPAGSLPLQTVFFGGGTPSLLSVSQLEQQFSLAQGRDVYAVDLASVAQDPL